MRLATYTIEYFDQSSARLRKWGVVLLAVAGVLWLWFVLALLTPYSADQRRGSVECESRFLTDRREANEAAAAGGLCEAERDWPELLAILGASIPVAVAGTAVFTAGATSLRVNRHMSQVVDAFARQDNDS